MSEVETWIRSRYGPVTFDQVEFETFNSFIHAAAVAVMGGVAMGMGNSRENALIDLYLNLTTCPTLEVELPEWWKQRRERSGNNA